MYALELLNNFDTFFDGLEPFKRFDFDRFPARFDKTYSIYEKEGQFFVEYQMAGLSEDDIKIQVNKETKELVITGKKETESEETEGEKVVWHHKGSVDRSFRMFLPDDLDLEAGVDANYENGQLLLCFNKLDKEEAKRQSVIDIDLKKEVSDKV